MFYINTPDLFKKRDLLLLQLLPTVVVFAALVFVSVLSWDTARNAVANEEIQALQQRNSETTQNISQRMSTYQNILLGSVGLFGASTEVTRSEWRTYLDGFDIQERYPGIQAVGFAQVISPNNLTEHLQSVRNQGFPNYSVKPVEVRDIYTSIVYIEPFDEKNQRAFGYDMFTEPVRKRAMEHTRDTGETTLSNSVALVQDGGEATTQPGLLMYTPVYRRNSTPTSLDERQNNIIGYTYAAFRSYDLFGSITETPTDNHGYRIYERLDDGKRNLLYETSNFLELSNEEEAKRTTDSLSLFSVRWEVEGISSPGNNTALNRDRPFVLLWGGLLLSLFVAGFLYLLLGNRSRALAQKEELNIQEAKDELLALASHQLRTPATGVKQYVGMLREGFAGKFSPLQKQLLEKAYASNERQLSTINEMLFVARADAGQLKMEIIKIDLGQMVRDIVEEQQAAIAARNQTIKLRVSKRPVYFYGDRQYLRMAFENIVSNASKYTPDNGHILVSLSSRANSLVFTVKDNGVGVPVSEQPLLFQKFSRIPNELTGQVSGSGIGLYLAKRVIDAHKGKIVFKSDGRSGSEVSVTLPKVYRKPGRLSGYLSLGNSLRR